MPAPNRKTVRMLQRNCSLIPLLAALVTARAATERPLSLHPDNPHYFLKPDNSVIKGGLPNHAHARALVEPGKQYAIYIFGGTQANLELDIPAGTYRVQWLHPSTGQAEKLERLKHPGGPVTLPSPAYTPDLALTLRRERR